jgi:trk system potassium uptake protein TrkH
MYPSILSAFRYAIFQVASIITTTGYVTADYGQWPMFSQMIIILLMFVGACAGSTGGGIKISRIVIFIKSAFNELKHLIHPRNVTSVKFEGQVVHKSVVNNILNYLVLYLLILCVSLLLVSLQNIDFASTFSAVVTCLNNVGPGLNIVGPVGNFSSLTNLSKLVLCFDMLAGRLEIFPILLLFSKDLWKK